MSDKFYCPHCGMKDLTLPFQQPHKCAPPPAKEEARKVMETSRALDDWREERVATEAPGKLEEGAVDEEFFREIIIDWKHDWMNQRQNSQADYENYHRRAFGIDANMQYDLARRLMTSYRAQLTEKDALLSSQGEELKAALDSIETQKLVIMALKARPAELSAALEQVKAERDEWKWKYEELCK